MTARNASTGFDLAAFWSTETGEHRQAFDASVVTLAEPFSRALELVVRSIRAGGKLLLFGNGGSAADAQHLAAELVVRYKDDRPAIPAIALTTDSSTLTAGGNDMGFETIFARQVEALCSGNDVVLGISTSGKSRNVLLALTEARRKGAATIGLAGGGGGSMHELCDVTLAVPSTVTARIQEMHILLGHMLCKGLEQRLGLMKI